MAVVVALVPRTRDLETIRVLRELLTEAEKGNLSGIAAVATYRGEEYAGFLTGYAKEHSTFTRGALDELKDEL